jgi:hypothetical protein
VSSFSPELSEKSNIERLSLEYDPSFLFLFFLILTALSGTVYILITIDLFRKLDINLGGILSSFVIINWSVSLMKDSGSVLLDLGSKKDKGS